MIGKIFTLNLFILMGFILSGQATLQLPANLQTDSIPFEWRGYNLGAKTNINWINNPDFDYWFPTFQPGIIRWPGGNIANNFDWYSQLNDNSVFNLKNTPAFINKYGLQLQMVLNFGNGFAGEAADFVRFCNSNTSYFRQLRDSLINHTDPLNIKYWEIGNESTDAWTFAWSWLGHQDSIQFRTGHKPKYFTRKSADSLYYYGGSFFREGWVNIIGGLDKLTAILGDLKLYSKPKPSDTISIMFPNLDTINTQSVRVFLTPGFDKQWAVDSASQQQIYDSISMPKYRLSAQEYSWNEKQVFIKPQNGIQPNDALLIEYNSIGHDGAFAFRDSIKNADQDIQVGYTVKLIPEISSDTSFQKDFAQSPPDFMIRHPYATSLTNTLLQGGLYTEALYAAQHKMKTYKTLQKTWNQRVKDWNIPNPIGISLTEWNIGLCDDCPPNHPFRGIAGAAYIANFWLEAFENGLADSIDFRVINHFATLASGNNFIHLLHANSIFEPSPEGYAVSMLMQTVGESFSKLYIDSIPQIKIISNQQGDTQHVDAVKAWGTMDSTGTYRLFMINYDDKDSQNIQIKLPVNIQSKYIKTQKLYGSITDEQVFYNETSDTAFNSQYEIQTPPYSLATIMIKTEINVGIASNEKNNPFIVYPNPVNHKLIIKTREIYYRAKVFDFTGKVVKSGIYSGNAMLNMSGLVNGIYFIQLQNEDRTTIMNLIKTD
jgi:type IX secretion system substrate protein